jgi:hypothetical protein
MGLFCPLILENRIKENTAIAQSSGLASSNILPNHHRIFTLSYLDYAEIGN